MLHVEHALIALGANLPWNGQDAAETLVKALAALAAAGLVPIRTSRMFRTPCFPAGAGPDYVNAAAVVQLPPGMQAEAVLAVLHRVEAEHGRARDGRWGMRTLDLDLLAIGDQVLPDRASVEAWISLPPDRQAQLTPDRLLLPHPRLQDRAFVLVPLADVAPDWRHPILGRTVTEMCEALPMADRAAVVPLDSGASS